MTNINEVGTLNTDDEEHSDDDLPEIFQRQVTQNPDPKADDCQYLSDDEIWEFLLLDMLEILVELRLRFTSCVTIIRMFLPVSEMFVRWTFSNVPLTLRAKAREVKGP